MSRIGKKAVAVPSGVTVTISGQTIEVKGPKGQLSWTLPEEIIVKQEGAELLLSKSVENTRAQAMWGLSRTLVSNMVEGTTAGFEKTLELVGVGYRAAMQGKDLNLNLGFSHPVVFNTPEGITISTPSQTEIVVAGADKQLVGEVAAKIRGYRPPEPYKGKGVKYSDETIIRKEAKKA